MLTVCVTGDSRAAQFGGGAVGMLVADGGRGHRYTAEAEAGPRAAAGGHWNITARQSAISMPKPISHLPEPISHLNQGVALAAAPLSIELYAAIAASPRP